MWMPRDRAFRRALRRFHHPWYRRLFPWVMFVFALLGAGRVALGQLVERWTRTTLADLQGFHGSYRRVDVFSWPPVYVMDGFRIESEAGDPVLAIERLEVHGELGDLLSSLIHQRPPTVRVRIARPRALLAGGTPVALAHELTRWSEHLPAVNVEIARVEDGQIVLGPEQGGGDGRLTTFLTGLKASASRDQLGEGMDIHGTAAFLGAGETDFRLHMPADPGGPVSGDLMLRYLALSDVYWLVEQALPPATGGARTLGLAGRFTLTGTDLRGAVRAVADNVGPDDLPLELLDRVRARLSSSAAPWVVAQKQHGPDGHELMMQGSLSPAGAGRWLEAVSVARTLFAEGVGAARAATPIASPSEPPVVGTHASAD